MQAAGLDFNIHFVFTVSVDFQTSGNYIEAGQVKEMKRVQSENDNG